MSVFLTTSSTPSYERTFHEEIIPWYAQDDEEEEENESEG